MKILFILDPTLRYIFHHAESIVKNTQGERTENILFSLKNENKIITRKILYIFPLALSVLSQMAKNVSNGVRFLIFFSLSLQAQNAETLFNTGVYFYQNGNIESASFFFDQALKLDPLNISILTNSAMTHRKLNNLDMSIALYEKLLELTPTKGDAAFGLAQAYLAKGIIDKGWQYFNRWRPIEVLQKCPQSLDDIAGKKIIIRAEWGLGDIIHFIRYAQILKDHAAYVILEAPESLIAILSSCPFIDEIIMLGARLPHTDYEIPLFYLPTLCKTTAQTIPAKIPYIFADKKLVESWKMVVKDDHNFKIGICWDVGHHDTNIKTWQRTIPLHNWLPLTTLEGVSLYSLQKDGKKQLEQLSVHFKIHHFENFDSDDPKSAFMDTAAIMQHLDLVITVDTSVAHVAGALGVPVWVLLPYSPDYRWTLTGSTTPWYPSMRLFRQTKSDDSTSSDSHAQNQTSHKVWADTAGWDMVMQEIIHTLKTMI